MSRIELVFDATLEAPLERSFAAVVEAAHLEQWFCDACESEPRLNGRLRMRWTRAGASPLPFEARWVEFAPPARAGFQGGHAGYPGGDAGTVWFELACDGTGTRLRVRHEVPAGAAHAELLEPWRAAWPRALERLRRHVAPALDARS